jgi:Nif-specific regulatory protein
VFQRKRRVFVAAFNGLPASRRFAMEIQTNRYLKGYDFSSSSVLSILSKDKKSILFHKIQRALHYIPNFVETSKMILDAVMDEMDAENCSLMLKDSISNELLIRAARGKNEGKTVYYDAGHFGNGNRFKLGEGVAGWVLEKGQPVLIHDVIEEPRFVRLNGSGRKVKSLLCVPIREKDQVVGVFNLSHSKEKAFNEEDKFILTYISTQLGAALTSACFFLEIEEKKHSMKDFRDVSFPKAEASSISHESSTFVEPEEIIQGNGLFIYSSEKMHRIKEIIDQVADTDVTVLIQGESGVGKEVVSRSIHLTSLRRDQPFIKVNCAAIPHELLESELFGYEKGAFTGAYRQKLGKFELANGGTIFLDEIVEIYPPLQGKLLQVLQDREFSRLGGKKDIHVDVRVVAATNKNIEELIKEGKFREDLFYRMNVVNIYIPPLRERKEEIVLFIKYFLKKFERKYNKKCKPLSGQMMEMFMDHPWPGNVRELENILHRYVVLGNEKAIIEEFFPSTGKELPEAQRVLPHPKKDRPSLKEVQREAVLRAETDIIRRVLDQTNWNRKKSAELLNVSYKALLYKIKGCGIHK